MLAAGGGKQGMFSSVSPLYFSHFPDSHLSLASLSFTLSYIPFSLSVGDDTETHTRVDIVLNRSSFRNQMMTKEVMLLSLNLLHHLLVSSLIWVYTSVEIHHC